MDAADDEDDAAATGCVTGAGDWVGVLLQAATRRANKILIGNAVFMLTPLIKVILATKG
ncbi:hypothetical protein [Uliginosibacterium sediminicola]|uniref:Uncharacterized protein n=1 Tax=Uliginosibacterium sediminicola TaxID=2024550 RepID=A0ABU9YV12_9RHOO